MADSELTGTRRARDEATPSRGAEEAPDAGSMPRRRWFGIAIGAALVVGSLIRIGWWWYAKPLTIDEAMLSLGLVGRTSFALPYFQVAPLGFVGAERVVMALFGHGERALRLLPFLAGLALPPVFVVLARRVLVDDVPVAVATWLVAVNRGLVAYGDQVKPYVLDATLAVTLTVVAMWACGRGPRRALVAGLLGAIAVWCSAPAVLVLAGIGIVWLMRDRRGAVVAGTLWLAAAAPAVWILERHVTPVVHVYMNRYWAEGFWTGWAWPIVEPSRTMSALFRFPPGFVWLALAVIGIVVARRRGNWAFVFAPMGIAVVVALAKLYPFADRLVLFLVPSVMLAVAAIAWSRAGLVVAAALITLQWAGAIKPYAQEDVRTLVSTIAVRRTPGDDVYVYFGAAPAYRFYAGADTVGVIFGRCHHVDWRTYLRDLDRLRGRRRVWLVMSHNFDGDGFRDDSLLVSYLRALGTAHERTIAGAAFAMSFDLDGAPRPDSISPDRFPSPPLSHPPQANVDCGGL